MWNLWLKKYLLQAPKDDEGKGGSGKPDPDSDPDFKEGDDPDKMDKGDEVDPDADPDADPDGADKDDVDPDADADADDDPDADKDKGDDDQDPDTNNKGKKDTGTVPRGRLNKEISKRRALEGQVNQLRETVAELVKGSKKDPEPTFDVDAKEDEYAKAISEGDLDKARVIRKEIRAFEHKELLAQIETRSTNNASRLTEEDRVATVIQQSQKDYPILDENSDDYDPDAVADALALQKGYIGNGMKPSVALTKAVEKVARMYGAEKVTVEKDDDGKEKKLTLSGKSKETTVKKKIAAAQQPPRAKGGDIDRKNQAEVDFSSLTDEEIAALPQATLRKLRGDVSA